MKINFSVLALTVFVIIPFLSIIYVLSVYESANAQVNIIPGTDEPANTTWNDERVELSVPSIIRAGRFNATDIVQTNTLKLDSDVKNLIILIPDKRLIAQNFLPLDATIIEGTNVVWVNGDKVSPHRITLEADGKMPPVFSNKTIPYQNGTEYTFDTQGTYKVSDPLNTDTYAPTGTINVIAPQYAPDNISTNSTQDTVGLFVVPAEGKDFFDKHFEMLGYRVKDDYRIPGPEGNNVQLYVYTVKSDRYLTIVNRTASILQFLPFPDLVHHPIIKQNFKGTIKTALFTEGLSHPTSMVFVDSATILVAEKDSGKIRKISRGVLEDESVLRVNVNSTGELGLLGIAVLKKEKQESTDIITDCNCSVFIYFTQLNENKTATKDNDNGNNNNPRNVIYKYDWDGESLTNPKLLVDLPAPPYHDSGKLRIGPDNQLYAVIGDLASPNSIQQNSILSNSIDNNDPSLTNNSSSVIIRINPDKGFPSKDNPFVKTHLNNSSLQMGSTEGRVGLDYYYSYGIRNSFGLAFDPLTEKLWATENGEAEYDEINIVSPGFNSGWDKIMGPVSKSNNFSYSDLRLFNDAYYSDPVFSWKKAIGATDIEFFASAKLGNKYANNLFVGDINSGNLYFFKVNDGRSGLNFTDIPSIADDLIANNKEEVNAVIVGSGFGGITDIETGLDGNLYILTFHDGRVYRITTSN